MLLDVFDHHWKQHRKETPPMFEVMLHSSLLVCSARVPCLQDALRSLQRAQTQVNAIHVNHPSIRSPLPARPSARALSTQVVPTDLGRNCRSCTNMRPISFFPHMDSNCSCKHCQAAKARTHPKSTGSLQPSRTGSGSLGRTSTSSLARALSAAANHVPSSGGVGNQQLPRLRSMLAAATGAAAAAAAADQGEPPSPSLLLNATLSPASRGGGSRAPRAAADALLTNSGSALNVHDSSSGGAAAAEGSGTATGFLLASTLRRALTSPDDMAPRLPPPLFEPRGSDNLDLDADCDNLLFAGDVDALDNDLDMSLAMMSCVDEEPPLLEPAGVPRVAAELLAAGGVGSGGGVDPKEHLPPLAPRALRDGVRSSQALLQTYAAGGHSGTDSVAQDGPWATPAGARLAGCRASG
jgi:hypothetical protein